MNWRKFGQCVIRDNERREQRVIVGLAAFQFFHKSPVGMIVLIGVAVEAAQQKGEHDQRVEKTNQSGGGWIHFAEHGRIHKH